MYFTYFNFRRKCIICETSEFLAETHSRCLAFHGIDIVVIQKIKGKSSLRLLKAGGKKTSLKQLKIGRRSVGASTPKNTMGKESIDMNDSHGSVETRTRLSMRTRLTIMSKT